MLKKAFLLFFVTFVCVFGTTTGNSFADELDKGLQQELADSRTSVLQAVSKLRAGGMPTAEIARLKAVAENIRASHLLMQERFKLKRQKSDALGGKASERLESVAAKYQKAVDDYLALIDAIPADGAVTQATLDTITALLDTISPPRKRPLLGSLPYKHLHYPAREPSSGPAVVPAYRGGDRYVVYADTAASAEAPISKEITDQANALSWNPVLIYEWVKNNVATEWYWGSMKGAEETLRQKSGNDADQAALLTSLLRASGFPTRYVRGTIEFFPNIDKAKNLTGMDDPTRIAAFLQKAGIPFKPVIAGGGISNFQIEHIWVESEIPYSNSRGAINDGMGKSWLALDTSIKPQGYTRAQGAGVPTEVLATFRDDYLNAVQTLSPLDFLTGKLDVSLAASQPGKSWSDLKDSATLIPDVLKIIPSGLQFPQIAITGEYQVLPDELKHKVAFTATAGGNDLFSITLDAQRLSNRKVTLRAEPETIEDQNLIDSFGGLDNTPPYLVRLRPVLTLDGERVVVAQDGLPMGEEFTLAMDIITPNGTERVTSSQITGNLSAIGVVSQKAAAPGFIAATDDAEAILHKEAIGYIDRWNKAEDDLAALMGQSVSRPAVTVATVGAQLEVTRLMDAPHDMQWKGLFLDAGYKRMESVGRNGTERDFMRLSALQGSILENRIFEDDLKVDSVSTAKLLQLASDNGAGILSIDKTNVDVVLPTLPFDDAVTQDIANAVNQNLTVRIPQAEIAYQNWSGVGYIKENIETGESGWMLSGNVAGGMTAWSVERWADDPATRMVAAALMAPYSSAPNADPATASMIAKINATDLQNGTTGEQLDSPLKVMVLDSTGRPVLGASVHFTVKAGGGGFDASGAASLDVMTDGRGIAAAPFFLGKKTDSNPTFVKESGKKNSVQVGENIVDAVLLNNGKGIVSPFTQYGLPGVLHHVVRKSQTRTDMVLNYAGYVMVGLEDKNDNPVSNSTVGFQAADAAGFASCYSSLTNVKPTSLVTGENACFKNNNIPYYGECGAPVSNTTQLSSYDGVVSLGVMLGSIPGARYDIIVTASDMPPETFSYATYPFGNQCGDNSDPSILLYTSYTYPVDSFGNNINAARSGSLISLNARNYATREDAKTQDVTACGKVCSQIIGARTFTPTTDFVKAGLTFTTSNGSGGTTDLDGQAQGNGTFSGAYTIKPGVNNITVKGAVSMARDRTQACPDCKTVHENIDLNSSTTMTVYGVDIEMPSGSPLVVTTDANGYSLNDLVVPFTITPAEYKALISYAVLYKNGTPVSYLTAEKSGAGKVTFLKGVQFELGNYYDIQVILNPGSGVEIKSDKVPLTIVGGQVNVTRTHHLSQFDAAVPVSIGTTYTDSYPLVLVKVSETATVKVSILDANQQNPVVLIPDASLPVGEYSFVLDYEMVRNAGFSAALNPKYYIQVKSTYGDPVLDHVSLYSGHMSERTEGQMLGQTMVHDVLIQDGSLSLSRQDFGFSGRGQQLAFARNYTNHSSAPGITPLGNGWTHSLDMKLSPLSRETTGAGGLPTWLLPLKGQIFSNSVIPATPNSWTMVRVNGAAFKKFNGVWYSERGRHGTLEEVASTATRPAGFLFTAKDGTRFLYNYALGDMPVSRIEDRNGNAMRFTYADQLLTNVTDAVGRVCNFSYATQPGFIVGDPTRLIGVACTDGVGISFTYDPQGYLKSAQRGARVETYDYALEGGIVGGEYNLDKSTDAKGHSFGYEYYNLASLNLASWNATKSVKPLKAQDVVKSVTYPGSGTTPVQARFIYDTSTANKRTVTDLRGKDTVYTLNYFGNPMKIEESLGKTTQMTWSIDEGKSDNVMTSKTDPRDPTYVTLYEYDAQGNVKKETDPYGKSIMTGWNQKFSLPESRTDRNLYTHYWQYDPKGNLLLETDGDSKSTNHTFFATGELETSRDPRGNLTTFTYGNWGNPASVKGAEGSLTKFEYDVRGRRTALIDPNGKRSEYAYDALDYPTVTTYPTFSSYALPAGSARVKTTVYDPLGNLVSETDRVGLNLVYGYTKRNQVETITRTGPGLVAAVKTFGYDENGNLLSETDWKKGSVATTHGYNELNQRTSTTNRLGFTTNMGYDLNGNLTSLTDAEGRVTTHAYDKLNRLTDTWQPALDGEMPGNLHNTYYDEADPKTNLWTERDQELNTTTYLYNKRYLRTQMSDANGNSHSPHIWDYDDNGNLQKETDEEGHFVDYGYDKQNRRSTMTQHQDDRALLTRYQYDDAGNRTHVIDPLLRDTESKYDEWSRPWQVIAQAESPYGQITTTTELDGEGRAVHSIDGNEHEKFMTRDSRGLVLTAKDAERNTTIYGYDDNGNNTSILDARTFLTKTDYDNEDRKTTSTQAFGTPDARTTGVLLFDKVGNLLQVRDGNGNVTTATYNALNLPWKLSEPAPFDGLYTETKYYKTGKVKSVQNRRGFLTAYEYDKLNRVHSVTDPLLQTVVTDYDNVGNVVTVTDKRTIETKNEYDDLYRLKKTYRAGLRLVTNEYDDVGNLSAVIDAKANRTEHSYTKRNQLDTTTFVVDGTFQKHSYDGVGNLLTQADEEDKVTSYTYDRENRQKTVELAGETTKKNYDEIGNLSDVIRPRDNFRHMEYDGLRRLISVTDDPTGVALLTNYQYDQNGNLRHQIDRWSDTEFTYDELNRKKQHIQHKNSGNLVTQYVEYDEEGNLKRLIDPKGQEFSYDYDKLNRQSDAHYPQVTTPYLAIRQIHTDYDENNNVKVVVETKADSSGGTVSDSTINDYDNFDRLKSSSERGLSVGYDYDDNGNRTLVATAAGATTYSFNKRNRLETAKVGSDTTTYDYYPDGKKKTVSYPNGAGESLEYYPSNRVKTVTNTAGGATISSYAYEYDENGNRRNQTEVQNGTTLNTSYGYDTLDRMTDYTVDDGTGAAYTFEGYNRATETVTDEDGEAVTKTYNYDETNWLTSVDDGTNAVSYGYDANGNTLRKSDSADPGNDTAFDYDTNNRLVRTMQGTTILGLYDYNAQGMRVRHRNSDRGDVDYYYDGRSVIEERQASGALLAHYNYADRLLSLATATGSQYYHFDALGSTVNLTDGQGNVQTSYFLNPWGMILDQIGESVNRHVFTGKELDANTGLVYFGSRYYDPDTARFISQDSYHGEAGTPPSLHRYLYAYSNPTVYTDLEGYASTKEFVNGMATEAANWFGDVVLGNKDGTPRVANNKIVSDQKNYTVSIEGANPAKWIKATTSQIDLDAGFKEKLTVGAQIESQLDYLTGGVSGMVKSAYEGIKGGVRTISSLKKSFDNSLSEAEQNAASFEAGQGIFDTAVFGAAVYSGYKLTNPGVRSITKEAPSGVGIRRILADETGSVGPDIGEAIARNKSKGGVAAEVGDVGTSTNGPYSHLNDHPSVGPTKPFTQTQKRNILDANRANNDGIIRSDKSETQAVQAQQHTKGIAPPSNEAHIDHIIPRSKGGSNSYSNAQVLTRDENLEKGAN